MFGIGFQEILLILLLALIFFGPKKLPDLAKSLGRGVAEFKKAADEVKKGLEDAVEEEEIKKEIEELKDIGSTLESEIKDDAPVEKIEKSELEAVEKEPSPEEIKIKEQASPDEG
jgi:Tat protein translocase TatB subunit